MLRSLLSDQQRGSVSSPHPLSPIVDQFLLLLLSLSSRLTDFATLTSSRTSLHHLDTGLSSFERTNNTLLLAHSVLITAQALQLYIQFKMHFTTSSSSLLTIATTLLAITTNYSVQAKYTCDTSLGNFYPYCINVPDNAAKNGQLLPTILMLSGSGARGPADKVKMLVSLLFLLRVVSCLVICLSNPSISELWFNLVDPFASLQRRSSSHIPITKAYIRIPY